jgi:hypothetical protein
VVNIGVTGRLRVKIRMGRTENSLVRHSTQTGCRQVVRAGAMRRVPERSSLPNSEKHRTTTATVEPSRLRLILQRLQDRFYDAEPASERIAAAVLTDVKALDESPPALPH